MSISEIRAKSLLRKHKKIDSWFITRYGMNFYRGCLHNCAYCDGRAEKYRVAGDFGRELGVKVNALELLEKALDPVRKKKTLKRCFMMLGGGVGDAYQPAEEKYRLSRQALEILNNHGWPVHILTKSTLVLRDLDLLEVLNRRNPIIVSFSFSSIDRELCENFEPGADPPQERLRAISVIRKRGIACGMFLMPVIPLLTDTPEMITRSVASAKAAGSDFVIFAGMTLKEGRQKTYFMRLLEQQFPEAVAGYNQIYRGGRWGEGSREYYDRVNNTFRSVLKQFPLSPRIPFRLYRDLLDDNDLVIVLLEQIDYLLRLRGASSPYGFAAWSLSKVKEPLASVKNKLRSLKGIGKVTERLIKEILNTGKCDYHEKLMNDW